jgi:hypothetical protein
MGYRLILILIIKKSNNNSIVQLIHKVISVAVVRERTITTEQLPLVGEVSPNFCG